jgi:hypothetical protein
MKASASALPKPPWRRRVLPLSALAYAAALALWVNGGEGAGEPGSWLAVLVAMAIGLYAAARPTPIPRAVGWGIAVVVASLGASGSSAGLDACAAVGAMVCAMGACLAIARVPSEGGMVRGRPVPAWPGLAALAVVWGGCVVAALARRGEWAWAHEQARAVRVAAEVVTVGVLGLVSEWSLRRRRLELGVVERATAMRGLLVASAAIAFVVGVLGRGEVESLGRALVALSSGLLAAAALHDDPVRVARVARRTVALVVVGGSVALAGASAASGRGWDAWGTTLATAALALGVGAVVSWLEGPLRPAGGAWLDAFARASAEANHAEPEDSVRAVLEALRGPGGPSSPAPELFTFSPPRRSTVDAAGYLHEEEAEVPEVLPLVAGAEPEATLRTEVLEALEVRRPELRSLSKWMNDRGAMLAALVTADGDAEGVLVLPQVRRSEAPTLEEVRALRGVAERLAAACRARATQERMLGRTLAAMKRAEETEEGADRLRHERALVVGRDALAATRLARPATVGIYAAASRMALEALERRTSVGAPVAVVAPSGVDPVPYLARAHLSGTRREAPLVLVDATSAREHDPGRWTDANASPLALADRGMLVLLDGAALPPEVQQLVARALAEKRTPWERPEPLDVQLALTAVASPDELVADGRLDASLALRLGDARETPVVLPRLRDRVEDLRALLTDRLAREGLRTIGRPVGIEHAAYARLVEHTFAGEDAELAAIVQRLVARCRAEGTDVVRARDVDALGLTAEAPARPSRVPRLPRARRDVER